MMNQCMSCVAPQRADATRKVVMTKKNRFPTWIAYLSAMNTQCGNYLDAPRISESFPYKGETVDAPSKYALY